MADPIKAANSARPGAVKGPVANANKEDDIDAMLAEFDAPSVQASPAADAPDDIDMMVNDVAMSEGSGGDTAQPPQEQVPNEFPVDQQSMQFAGADFNIAQQVKDAGIRVAGKLAGDPKSLELTLKNKLGPQNVKVTKSGGVYWKFSGDKAFRKFDPGTFEVYSDLISDNFKELAQTGAGVATAGASPLIQGAAIAGTTAAVDAYGKSIGVVKDQSQYATEPDSLMRPVENTIQYSKEALEYVAIDRTFRFLGDKWAARRARVDGIKKLEEVPVAERLQESVKQNMETLNDMKQLGMTQNITGTNVEVPAHQLLPFDPKVQKIAQSVSAEKSFQQAQKEAAENFSTASLDLVEEAANLTRGNLQKVIKTGVPLEKEITVKDVSGLFNQVRRAEGTILGEFRDKVRATAKKTPLPSPKTAEAVESIFNQLGIKRKGAELVFPKKEQLMQVLGTDSEAFVKGFTDDLVSLNNKLLKGGLNVDELLGQSQIIGAKNEGARRIGGLYKGAIGKLSSALRSDSREGVAMLLSPEDALTYTSKMGRFKNVAESMDQLERYLADDIGMNTFARGLVNKGKDGIANLRAAKEFLLQENPEMYRNLVGQVMEEFALKHRTPGIVGGYNTAGMRKDLAGLGDEYLKELFPKGGRIDHSVVLRSFDLAEQLQKSIVTGGDSQLLKDAKRAAGSLSMYHRGVNTVYAMMRFGDKNNRLLKLLSREGVESFLTEVPVKQKGPMRETLKAILSLSRKNGTLATINSFNSPDTKAQGNDVPVPYRDPESPQ